MSKTCQNIVNKRITKISELIIEGKSRRFIVQFVSENWNLSERQADNYISKSNELIKSELIRDAELCLARVTKRLEFIYQRAIEIKDYRLALQVNKEISVLQGLAKTQIEHSGDITFICSVPD